jgi:hypothetical protein
MSGPISRDDAVLAARLWGLASHRYVSTSVLPLNGPEHPSLYAGFEHAGIDPVEALTALSFELHVLAMLWADWQEAQDTRVAGRRT